MIERVYTVPLRKGFRQTADYKKTKKAVSTLKIFLSKHLKQSDITKIYIGRNLNKELWKHGIKNPPAKIKVVVIKEDNGDVKAELYGTKYDHKKKAEKEDKADTKKDSKLEEKAKESRKKSTTAETHEHTHEDGSVHTHEHNHEEKHEHAAGQTHEHVEKPKKVVRKTVVKKKSE